MAISKKARRAQESKAPDAAAFVSLIDKGLAEPEHVSAAYDQALRESTVGMTYAEVLQAAIAHGGVVQQCPVADPETPEARLIRLHRHHTFKGTDAQPTQIQNPQEEA